MYGVVVWPLLQIHDELLFEVRSDYADEVKAICVYVMENVCRLLVPLVASGVNALTWGDLPK